MNLVEQHLFCVCVDFILTNIAFLKSIDNLEMVEICIGPFSIQVSVLSA